MTADRIPAGTRLYPVPQTSEQRADTLSSMIDDATSLIMRLSQFGDCLEAKRARSRIEQARDLLYRIRIGNAETNGDTE